MRLLRENACAQRWARGPPTHLFTRSFVHSSTGMSSGAPVTCPALSGHQAAARSVAGSHRLGVDLLCRSQARRQWCRVGAGSLSCEDAMRARRRSGRGAREFTAPPSCPASPRPPSPYRQNHRFVPALAHAGAPVGLAGWGQLAPPHPSQWAGGRLPLPRRDSLLASPLPASPLPCLAQTVSVSSRTSSCPFGALPHIVPAPGPSAHWGQCVLKVTPDLILVLPLHASRRASQSQRAQGQPGKLCLRQAYLFLDLLSFFFEGTLFPHLILN